MTKTNNLATKNKTAKKSHREGGKVHKSRRFMGYDKMCALFIATLFFHGAAYAKKKNLQKLDVMSECFSLLSEVCEYHRAVLYGDLKKEYSFMTPRYKELIPYSKFRDSRGAALPLVFPSKDKQKERKSLGSISGRKLTSAPPLMLPPMVGMMGKANKKVNPDFHSSNKLFYKLKKVKISREGNKALVFFEYTEFVKMPIPMMKSPFFIFSRKGADLWIKKGNRWYRDVKGRTENISGHSFTLQVDETQQSWPGVTVKTSDIVRSKLAEIKKRKESNKDTPRTALILTRLSPFKVYSKAAKISDEFKKYVTEAFDVIIKDLNFAMTKAPTASIVSKKIGKMQRLLGKHEESTASYLRSISLDEHDVDSLLNLSDLFLRKKEYKKAVEYFDKYLSLNLKVRQSAVKPKIQIWLESNASSSYEISEMISQLGKDKTWRFVVELIKKRQWRAAEGLIKKLYANRGYKKQINSKISNKLKKLTYKDGHKGVFFKVSDFVPLPFQEILSKLNVFEVSKIVELLGYNVYRTKAFIGETGVETPVDIRVRSGCYFVLKNRIYGKYDGIIIGRRNVSPKGIGYNIAVIDEKSGKVLKKGTFNTFATEGDSERLAGFIDGIKKGRIVAVSSREEFAQRLKKIAVTSLYSIGAGEDSMGKDRWAHAIIGVKGAKKGTAVELLSPYPANINLLKKNTFFSIDELHKNKKKIKNMNIKRKSVFLAGLKANDTFLLVFP